MVSQKKLGSAKKPTQMMKQKIPPKMFEVDESDDDDEDLSGMESDEMDPDLAMESGSDSSEEISPKKSGGKKEKHVAFQLPGKGTPASATKIPKNLPATPMPRNPKQQTPKGKSALAEFPGMKGTPSNAKSATPAKEKNAKATASLLEMADDDDEDDDDFDEEEDDEDDDEEGDSEEDDEEEDEDLDSGEEEEIKQKILGLQKVRTLQKDGKAKEANTTPNKQKQTPAKNAATPKNIPAGKQQNASPQKQTPPKMNKTELAALNEAEKQRRRERDARCLFVKNFPADVSEQELKALSLDIIAVSLPHILLKNKGNRKNRGKPFAFLEFASEKKAIENLPLIKAKKLRGQPLYVDFTGEKSATYKGRPAEQMLNPKRLYVTGFPTDVQIKDFAAMFPKATEIRMNVDPGFRSITIEYNDDKDAAADVKANSNAKYQGRIITVVHSHKNSFKRKEHKKPSGGPPAKRQRVEVKTDQDDGGSSD